MTRKLLIVFFLVTNLTLLLLSLYIQKTPTSELYNQCIKILTELEQTYNWKLTLDKERLKYKDYLDINFIDLKKNKLITNDHIILNEELLNLYEKQLQCTNRLLNCIQNDLKYCHDGLTSQIGAYIDVR